MAAVPAVEGAGVRISRVFGQPQAQLLDPFLLLDEFRSDDPNDYIGGFPDHPHRGFETVTYLLDGPFEHRDSFGNHGVLNPGDVQWMAAGSGLVGSEAPGAEVFEKGGRLQGFQLWVNLPKAHKMAAPKYQELKAGEIPTAVSGDGKVSVKVIAGEALGRRAAIGTFTPIQYLHFTIAPGGEHTQEVPHTFNAIAYVVKGRASVAGETVTAGHLALLAKNGDTVTLENRSAGPLDLLLIGGEPIGEPVARYGPFVMNSQEELYQAFDDYRNGRMGTIKSR
jgi:redox-sensitive bicupin YhaK (pirin superfamily)